MDKWKDMELEKMKAGGNRKARDFFTSQSDYNASWSLQDKYNSRAAALYRDKVKPATSLPSSLTTTPPGPYRTSTTAVLLPCTGKR